MPIEIIETTEIIEAAEATEAKNRKRREPLPPPKCTDTRACFAREEGECQILDSNDFCGKPCPFCKSREERENGLSNARIHLEEIGREDLRKKYKS